MKNTVKEPISVPKESNLSLTDDEIRIRNERQFTREANALQLYVDNSEVSSGYYTAFSLILKELLDMEVAQKCAEYNAILKTKDDIVNVSEQDLHSFRSELEKLKTIFMVTKLVDTLGLSSKDVAISESLLQQLYPKKDISYKSLIKELQGYASSVGSVKI